MNLLQMFQAVFSCLIFTLFFQSSNQNFANFDFLNLLPNPNPLPSPTELFRQFAALLHSKKKLSVVNGTCNVDWDNLPNDDPDINLDTCELLAARGLGCQVVNVINGKRAIQLHRIVSIQEEIKLGKMSECDMITKRIKQTPFIKTTNNCLKNNFLGRTKATTKRYPVILQPGLLGTSADFIMASAEFDPLFKNQDHKLAAVMGANMGLELYKRGYDVWLSNNRGNKYASNNSELDSDQDIFWNWTFEQMATENLPSIVETVVQATDAAKVHYVGHSQGTAVMFVQLSKNPEFSEKLASFSAISPITRIGQAKTTFRYFVNLFDPLFELGNGPIFTPNYFIDNVIPYSCGNFGTREACKLVYFSITGPNCEELDMKRLSVYLSNMPTTTSSRNLRHFNQLFLTNRFAAFNPLVPEVPGPDYNLKAIKGPQTLIIYGQNDWFVPLSGIEQLKADLADRSVFNLTALSKPLANHIDPLIGKTLAPETNQLVYNFLEKNDQN